MELGSFTPKERASGDQLPAKEAAGRTLVVQVREHRTGVKTQYKPEGANAVIVDLADVDQDAVWCDVLWMNGAIVDNLAPYVGSALPITLSWAASQSGGHPYLSVSALESGPQAQAEQWASANPQRFDQERATRGLSAPQPAAQPAPGAATGPGGSAPAAGGSTAPVDPNDPKVQALLQQVQAGQ